VFSRNQAFTRQLSASVESQKYAPFLTGRNRKHGTEKELLSSKSGQ